MEKTQREIHAWSTRNFGERVEIDYNISSFLGMVEELGEIAHAVLKLSEGIRGTREENLAAIEDGVGDLLIFTLDFCARNGLDAEELLRRTWDQVKQRDWRKSAVDGGEAA